MESVAKSQGLRHADENGGGGRDQAAAKPGFSSEGNPYQKPKTQRIWPTIFLKMGGYPPHSKKWGDASPRPPSPLWRSPCQKSQNKKAQKSPCKRFQQLHLNLAEVYDRYLKIWRNVSLLVYCEDMFDWEDGLWLSLEFSFHLGIKLPFCQFVYTFIMSQQNYSSEPICMKIAPRTFHIPTGNDVL